jgi:predicted ester cyclase
MSEANKQLAIRWFEEVWNQRSEAAIDRMYGTNGKSYGFPDRDSVIEGPEAFKEIHRIFLAAFGDVHVDIKEVIAEGDRVAVRWQATQTHVGDYLGIPPTGKKTRIDGSSFITVKDGVILEGYNQMDMQLLILELKEAAV